MNNNELLCPWCGAQLRSLPPAPFTPEEPSRVVNCRSCSDIVTVTANYMPTYSVVKGPTTNKTGPVRMEWAGDEWIAIISDREYAGSGPTLGAALDYLFSSCVGVEGRRPSITLNLCIEHTTVGGLTTSRWAIVDG